MQTTEDKTKNFTLDPVHMANCVKNVYAGLNKGCNKGSYDLREAGQLSQDMDYIAASLGYLMKLQEEKKPN